MKKARVSRRGDLYRTRPTTLLSMTPDLAPYHRRPSPQMGMVCPLQGPKALPLWADIPTTTLRVWILRFAGRYEQASSLAIRNIEAADRSGVERWRAAPRLHWVAVPHYTSQNELARTHR